MYAFLYSYKVHTALLRHASMHASSFQCTTIVDQLHLEHRPLATNAIKNLVYLGLMNICDNKDRYTLPPVIKIIAR